MKRYVLDTSALLTLRDDELGAERVAAGSSCRAQPDGLCYF